NMDLEQMIFSLVEKVEKTTEIKTSLSYDVMHLSIPPDLKINIYRIMQELMTNILKHSASEKVDVVIKSEENSIHISVKDNGKGFSINETSEGVGLLNITNRVDTFNGKIEIISEPGQGCSTTIK